MSYTLKASSLAGIPRTNSKGEYAPLIGSVLLESTDGKGARIGHRVELVLTDTEKQVLDGIHKKFQDATQKLFDAANS